MSANGIGARTFVVGVGMTKFEKPGARDWDYPDMAREAGTKALEDAGIPYDAVEQALHTLLLEGGAGEHAGELQGNGGLADAEHQFLDADLLTVQILLGDDIVEI